MSVWRNEEDFMSNVDNMLSEFYIKDKSVTNSPKKLNIQQPMQKKSWYESDSDEEFSQKDANGVCPSMEPLDTHQMMKSIRMQVRTVVGDRYSNDVLEKLYKMDQEPAGNVPEVASSFMQQQVSSSDTGKMVNGVKKVEEPVASTSKLNNSNNNVRHKNYTRGRINYNRGRGVAPARHNNVALTSLESKQPFNRKVKDHFPPL